MRFDVQMQNIHTQIEQPKLFRQALLQTALDAAEARKTFEHLTSVQEEKKQVKEALTEALAHLQMQVTTFLKSIPPLPEEFSPRQKQTFRRAQKIKNMSYLNQIPLIPEPGNEFDADIAAIKDKLNKLRLS